MAILQSKRQKQLEQKRRKRKEKRLKASATDAGLTSTSPAIAAKAPVYECVVPDSTFEIGIGNLLFSRSLGGGRLAVSTFLVDAYCLGIKNALYSINSEVQYAHYLSEMGSDATLRRIDPCCFRKLIEGAITYARDLGFEPHHDYARVSRIFGDVDGAECAETFQYGEQGKPHYIRGPNENQADVRRIIERLRHRVGDGNFNFTLMPG